VGFIRLTSQRLVQISKKAHEALSGMDDIIVAYVFGSTAREKDHAFSDIDVAVLLKEPSVDKTMKIHSALTKALGDKVETLLLNLAPSFLKYQVIKTGIRILSKDEKTRIEFEAKALSEGLDEGFLIKKTREDTQRRLTT